MNLTSLLVLGATTLAAVLFLYGLHELKIRPEELRFSPSKVDPLELRAVVEEALAPHVAETRLLKEQLELMGSNRSVNSRLQNQIEALLAALPVTAESYPNNFNLHDFQNLPQGSVESRDSIPLNLPDRSLNIRALALN